MAFASGNHIVLGLLLLKHKPHGLDKIACMAPITKRLEIAKVQPILKTLLNTS